MLYFKLLGAIFLFLFFWGKLAQSSHWQSKPHLPVYLPTSSQDLKSNPDSSSIRKKKKKSRQATNKAPLRSIQGEALSQKKSGVGVNASKSGAREERSKVGQAARPLTFEGGFEDA